MKYVRIVKDTFISGILAKKGDEYEVDDRTAVMLGTKAIEIDGPGGKEKIYPDDVMMSIHTLPQPETVIRPIKPEKKQEKEEEAGTEQKEEVVVEMEKQKIEGKNEKIIERGTGGRFKKKKSKK